MWSVLIWTKDFYRFIIIVHNASIDCLFNWNHLSKPYSCIESDPCKPCLLSLNPASWVWTVCWLWSLSVESDLRFLSLIFVCWVWSLPVESELFLIESDPWLWSLIPACWVCIPLVESDHCLLSLIPASWVWSMPVLSDACRLSQTLFGKSDICQLIHD